MTIHMVINWIYGRNENPLLEAEMYALLREVEPESVPQREELCV
jgi:hypothetical protein